MGGEDCYSPCLPELTAASREPRLNPQAGASLSRPRVPLCFPNSNDTILNTQKFEFLEVESLDQWVFLFWWAFQNALQTR